MLETLSGDAHITARAATAASVLIKAGPGLCLEESLEPHSLPNRAPYGNKCAKPSPLTEGGQTRQRPG